MTVKKKTEVILRVDVTPRGWSAYTEAELSAAVSALIASSRATRLEVERESLVAHVRAPELPIGEVEVDALREKLLAAIRTAVAGVRR